MNPVEFKEQNAVVSRGDCIDLPAYVDKKQIISCWRGTFLSRLKFLFTGVVWFSIASKAQPPIWIGTTKPFKKGASKDV